MFQDFAEAFAQRADELDTSGELGRLFEFLWAVLSDGRQTSFSDRLTGAVPAAALFCDQLNQEFAMRSAAAGRARLLSNPSTGAHAADLRARLDAVPLEGWKILMAAQSQGNLFANLANDHVVPRLGAASVRVVHVAPASPTLRRPYALGETDLVSNGLRVRCAANLPLATRGGPCRGGTSRATG
jgi:hypothetical protein